MARQAFVIAGLALSVSFLLPGAALAQNPPPQEFVLEFGGAHVAVAPDVPELNLGSEFTMEGWVFMTRLSPPNDPPPFQLIMGKVPNAFATPPHVSYVISVSPEGKLEFVQSTDSGGAVRLATASAPAPLRTWIHVAATLGGGTMRLFVNGQQVATETSPGPPENTAAFALGGGDPGTINPAFANVHLPFSSIALREVRVWNRTLSAGEIMNMMGLTLTGNEPGLAAYWPLDDGHGQNAHDVGPNGVNLQLGLDPGADLVDPRWTHTTTLDNDPFFVQEGPFVVPEEKLSWGGLIDFDNDGDLDAIVTEADFCGVDPGPIAALRNDGGGSFSDDTAEVFANQIIEVISARAFAIADFNGDGLTDFYIGDQGEECFLGAGSQNRILIQSSAGQMFDETDTRLPASIDFTHSVTAGDIDSDGDVDLYVGNICCGANFVYMLINDGTGFFSMDTTRLSPPPPPPDEMAYTSSIFVDIDRDNDLDLILGSINGLDGPSLVYLNDGTGHFNRDRMDAIPLHPESLWDLTSADFDGDGWPDLLGVSSSAGQTADVRFYLNNRDGTFRDASNKIQQNWENFIPGHENIFFPHVADFNDDGKLDFVVQSGSNVAARFFLNTGEANFIDATELLPQDSPCTPISCHTTEIGWNTSLGSVLPGDLDGDGDTDIVSAVSHFFYVIRNVKPITTFPIPGPPANDTSDTPDVITASPFDGTADTSGAATDSSDPIPSCGGGTQNKSVWYQFTSPDNGTITADTFGSSYDTVLSAWTGAPGGFTQIACNDDSTPPASLEAPARTQTTATGQSRVVFAATAGVTYAFMISAKNDDGGSLAFNLSFQASAVLPTTTLQTVIPHSAEGGGFLSRLFVTNLTNATNNVLINRVNQSGAVVESSTLALQPAATTQISAGEEARTEALDVAWFTVGSDGSVAASVLFEFDSASLNLPENFRTAVGALASEPLTAFTAPVRVATVDVTVGLALADLSGSSNTVNMALMDQDGLIVAQDSLTLSAFQQTAFSLQDRTAFRDIILGVPEFIGSLAVTTADANKPVAAIVVGNNLGQLFALPVIPGTASSSGSNLTAPTALTRVPFPGSAQAIPSGNFTTIIPHSAAGGGFLSRLFIVNLSSNSNSITVNRVGQDGTVLETSNATLQAAATLVFADPEEVRNQDLAVQWFAIGSEMPIGASLLFEFDSESLGLEENFQTAVGSLAAEPLNSFTTPLRVATVDVTAGVALANVNDASTTVNLRLIDENGTTVAQDSISLGASQQTAFSLQDRAAFRDIILRVPEFIGSLAVTTSNPSLPVAALVIGNNLGQLFALPVTPGVAQ